MKVLDVLAKEVPVRVAALVIVAALAAPATQAQSPRPYRTGKDAAEAKRWAQVEKSMREAIAEDPEARRLNLFSRYTPYYFLGVALAEQGDCRGALEAWELTDRYGALREGGDEEQDMEQRRERCTKLVDEVKRIVATTREAIDEAEEAAAGLDRMSRQENLAPLWSEGADSFASRVAAARQKLQQARSKLERGDAELDRDVLAEAGYQAAEALGDFNATLRDVQGRLSAVNEAVSSAMSELDEAEKRARSLLRSVRRVGGPYPDRLGRQVGKLRRVLSRSEEERDVASAEELAALTEELEEETRRLRPLAAGPPNALQDAGAAYLANDFQGVLDLLAEQTFDADRERFHAGLLEAAALFGLYVTHGEEDVEALGRCRQVIRELAAMDAELGGPGERFFSPRFRALYAEVFAEVAAAEKEAVDGPGDGAAENQDAADLDDAVSADGGS